MDEKEKLNQIENQLKLALTNLNLLKSKPDRSFAKPESVAVIGMACRFPGTNNNLSDFWDLIESRKDAISEEPKDRIHQKYYSSSNPKIPKFKGGYIENVDEFDHHFFNLSPREVQYMDPQQRLVLLTSYEALENASLPVDQLKGSKTGVFVGITNQDYFQIIEGYSKKKRNIFEVTGNLHCAVSNRLSYLWDLKGPSLSIDTASSSSLVALHLACQSLIHQESDIAIAGGVSLLLSPRVSELFSEFKMLAKDGRCKAFDDRADGYVRSEGCGIVICKHLEKAEQDGDSILAVIKGSAVNQDGLSKGFTVPNSSAQQQLMRLTLKNSGIEPQEIDYVEAHGTGTRVGDPIEAHSIGEVYGKSHSKDHPLFLGSVKTNIGHLEAAAGISGFIKTVLMLQNEKIVANANLQRLNHKIPWSQYRMTVPQENVSWSKSSKPRLAAVCSYGINGTNAHVLLGDYLKSADSHLKKQKELPVHLLCISAKTQRALFKLLADYRSLIQKAEASRLSDICITSQFGRAHYGHRLTVIAKTKDEFIEKLNHFISHKEALGVSYKKLPPIPPRIGFLFTGHGAHYLNMGKQLYEIQSDFKKAIHECNELLQKYLEHTLSDLLWGSQQSLLDQQKYLQPVLLSLQYALAKMWVNAGVIPEIVAGHSGGEYAAACIAGVFSLDDALKLVSARGRLVEEMAKEGRMIAVNSNVEGIEPILTKYINKVFIAVYNSPVDIVLSGDIDNVGKIYEEFKKNNVQCKILPIAYASHCPLVEPMLETYFQVLQEVNFQKPKIKIISTVTGKISDELNNSDYWIKHLLEPVQYNRCMDEMENQRVKNFIEIGPGSTLIALGQKCISNEEHIWLTSLRKDHEDWRVVLNSLSQIYLQGHDINWKDFKKGFPYLNIQLPNYPFQYKNYWIDSILNSEILEQDDEIELENKKKPGELYANLSVLDPNEREEALAQYLQNQIAKLLGVNEVEEIEMNKRFFEMGFDSLTAVALKKIIAHDLDKKLSDTIIFDFPNIQRLTKRLFIELFQDNSQQVISTTTGKKLVEFITANQTNSLDKDKVIPSEISDGEAEVQLLREIEGWNNKKGVNMNYP